MRCPYKSTCYPKRVLHAVVPGSCQALRSATAEGAGDAGLSALLCVVQLHKNSLLEWPLLLLRGIAKLLLPLGEEELRGTLLLPLGEQELRGLLGEEAPRPLSPTVKRPNEGMRARKAAGRLLGVGQALGLDISARPSSMYRFCVSARRTEARLFQSSAVLSFRKSLRVMMPTTHEWASTTAR